MNFSRARLVGCAWLGLAIACARDPLQEAQQLQKAGRFQESVDLLRPVVEEHPDDAEVNYLYGLALVQSGQRGLAVWPLRRAILSPDRAVAGGVMLASALLSEGNYRDAVTAADQVLALEPDNVAALGLRARARLALKQNAEALADADRVLEIDPDSSEILTTRILALIELQRLDEAEEAMTEVSMRLDQSHASPAMLASLCAARATFLRERGDVVRAGPVYEECLVTYPGNYTVVSEAVAFFDSQRRPDRSLEIMRAAVAAEPEVVALRAGLSNRLSALGNVEEAERLLLDATGKDASAAAWLALIEHYVERRKWSEAASAMHELLAVYEEPPTSLLFTYADLLVEQGDFEQATKLAKSMKSPMQDLLLGKMELERGNSRKALEWFESGIRLWPDNAAARYLAGRAAEQIGDFDRAVSEYQLSAQSDASATEAGLRLAELQVRQQELKGARFSIGQYLNEHPMDPEALTLAARIEAQLGDRAKTIAFLNRLGTLRGQAGRALAEAARIRLDHAGPEAAIAMIQSSPLDLEVPAQADALRVLIHALGAAQRDQDAVTRTRSASKSHPDTALFHELLGDALSNAGEPEAQVRAAYERAVSLEPGNARALAGLARIAARSDLERALTLYDQATTADPEQTDCALAAVELLQQSDDPTRRADAERRLEAVLSRDPANDRAASQLARILAERPDQLDRALDLAHTAVRFGSSPEAWDALGVVRMARHETAPAIEAFNRALERRPESASTRYRLGVALAAAGRAADARAAFDAALVRGDFPEAGAAREQLTRLNAASGAP